MKLESWIYWNKEEIIIKESLLELFNGSFITDTIKIATGKGETITEEEIREGVISSVKLNEKTNIITYFDGNIKIRSNKNE